MSIKYRFALAVTTLFLLGNPLKAQTDNEFWFAAPDVSSAHGDAPYNGAPLNLHITAVHATYVKISRPADPLFPPAEFSLSENESYSIRLDTYADLSIDQIETYPQADLVSGVQNKGFLIEAYPGEVTAYYELDQYWNRDIFSLKGRNALGTEFRVSTQNSFPNGAYGGTAFSGFVIVATEDNTTVMVYQNAAWFYFPTVATRVLHLDKGETFAFRAVGTAAAQHINGVRVIADKAIAITVYDDSVRKKNTLNANCASNLSYDIVGDQIVPISNLGTEYIIMKGEVTDIPACDGGERVFITSVEDNTAVYVDGMLFTSMVSAGSVCDYQLSNNATCIHTSKPVSVFHITGFGGEMGGAIVPPFNGCSGSDKVTFRRSPNALDQFYVNIVVKNDTAISSPDRNQAINHFTLTVNGITNGIPPSYFEYIMDSSYAVLRNIPAADAYFSSTILPGSIARVANTVSTFHLSMINGGASTGVKYAYFTDFSPINPSAGIGGAYSPTQEIVCGLDSFRLVAAGGISYHWQCINNSSATAYISDTTAADPWFYPQEEGDYLFNVTIGGECFSDTTLALLARVYLSASPDFSITEHSSCTGLSPTINNLSDPAFNEKMIWVFENPYMEINQDTIPMSFGWSYPENTTDTVQSYPVALYSYRPFNCCRSVKYDTVRIFPSVHADFSMSTTRACSSMEVSVINESTGNNCNYFWNSGMGEISVDTAPVFTYYYTPETDTIVPITLIVSSESGCADTIIKTVEIVPEHTVHLMSSAREGCSPFMPQLWIEGAEQADSIFWYFYQDDEIIALYSDSLSLNPVFANLSLTSDTLPIELNICWDNGCRSTIRKEIIIYPEVTADFSAVTSGTCSPVEVQLQNQSEGALQYLWDFGNGETSGLQSPSIVYSNESDNTVAYRITLIAMSMYGCTSDPAHYDVTVDPAKTASIALSEQAGCSPFESLISGTESNQADSYVLFVYYPENADSVWMEPEDIYSFEYRNTGNMNDTVPLTLIPNASGGCVLPLDTFLVVYPEVTAGFDLNYGNGISPVSVTTMNYSINATSFFWDFGDGTASVEEDPIHIYTSDMDTTYILVLTAMSADCSDTAAAGVNVSPPLAIRNDRLTNNIHAYFRPDPSELIIEYRGESATLKSLFVFDISGSLILSRECNFPLDENSKNRIAMDELVKGNLYILTMVIGNGIYNLKIFYP